MHQIKKERAQAVDTSASTYQSGYGNRQNESEDEDDSSYDSDSDESCSSEYSQGERDPKKERELVNEALAQVDNLQTHPYFLNLQGKQLLRARRPVY